MDGSIFGASAAEGVRLLRAGGDEKSNGEFWEQLGQGAKQMTKITIEQAHNGYTMDTRLDDSCELGRLEVYSTLDELFQRLVEWFEKRNARAGDDSKFGAAFIIRERDKAVKGHKEGILPDYPD